MFVSHVTKHLHVFAMEQVEIRRLKLELEAKDKEIERLRAAIEEQVPCYIIVTAYICT